MFTKKINLQKKVEVYYSNLQSTCDGKLDTLQTYHIFVMLQYFCAKITSAIVLNKDNSKCR